MRAFTLLIVLICLSTCSSKKDKQREFRNKFSDTQYSIIPFDTVNIPIDSATSNFTTTFRYSEIGRYKLFSIYNHNKHKIQVYDIENRKMVGSINLKSDGPDAIPELLGFHIHSFDSLFLFAFDENRIFLIDTAGIVKNIYEVNETLGNGNNNYEIALNQYFETSFDPRRHLLTFWVQPFLNRRTAEYYKFPLAIDYNTVQKRVERNYGYYPDAYRESNFYFLREDLHRTISRDYEIHHFSCSHELYLYEKDKKELIKKIFVKSKYLPDHFVSIVKEGDDKPDLQQQANYNITQGRYRQLLYDSQNNLYYRIVRHQQELKAPDGLLNGKLDSKLSVMILDSEFKIAGEVELPEKVFLDFVSFVSDGLLWININHPKNSLNHEDSFQFILYKPLEQ